MCGSRRLHTAAKIIKDPELSEEIVEAQGLDVQLGSRRLAALSHVLSQGVNMTLDAAAGLSCTHSLCCLDLLPPPLWISTCLQSHANDKWITIGAMDAVGGAAGAVGEAVGGAAGSMGAAAGAAVGGASGAMQEAAGAMSGAMYGAADAVGEAVGAVGDAVGGAAGAVGGAVGGFLPHANATYASQTVTLPATPQPPPQTSPQPAAGSDAGHSGVRSPGGGQAVTGTCSSSSLSRQTHGYPRTEGGAGTKTNTKKGGNVVSQTMTMGATIDVVYAVIADVLHYQDWSGDGIQSIHIRRCDEGLTEVEYKAGAFGYMFDFALVFDLKLPNLVRFELLESAHVKKLEGAYELTPVGDDKVEVSFELLAELARVPMFIQSAIANLIIGIALGELNKYVTTERCRSNLKSYGLL